MKIFPFKNFDLRMNISNIILNNDVTTWCNKLKIGAAEDEIVAASIIIQQQNKW